ncbi:glycoside hydrolase 43 family protein [Marinimicrobium sp. LS-A18]|uniref:glycoside hydrolase family 43 protein n=1 Tax=Marinimicrobium sp. LS-A18 TaxID=1381596 RepID=UPI0004671775|nr:glycoside hydrolase 43 family protein [Marinimicrobium sp. LS-A18]
MRQRTLLAALGAASLFLFGCQSTPSSDSSTVTAPWVSDLGDGTYKNPVIYADYSDPDVVQVDGTYYMTSSSFNSAPGLPLLTSKDMVNWELVGHAVDRQIPRKVFDVPQHGNGIWAPCLRYHDGKFWIFWGDPDFGIYQVHAEDFAGPWSEPHLVVPGKDAGLIDPTPLWDDDGQAYLLHGWAKSRAGLNNILTLRRMAPDASKVYDEGETVIDGFQLPGYRTLEGPKFYKRNGYYYIFAPAGGVEPGWQSVFRARNVDGPYEDRIVLAQGDTEVNGPHQGAWVQTPEGDDWFIHFQSKETYGRIVHLQPVRWRDDWPEMGQNVNADGLGEPVLRHRKPVEGFLVKVPVTTDEFSGDQLGVQWQWNANYYDEWFSLTERAGHLRLFAHDFDSPNGEDNLWLNPALVMQKVPAPAFTMTTVLEVNTRHNGDRAGLVMFGEDYGWIGLEQRDGQARLVQKTCVDARTGCDEQTQGDIAYAGEGRIYLRLHFHDDQTVDFEYSLEGDDYQPLGERFQTRRGRWVGGKIGLFVEGGEGAYADADYFRVTPPAR